MSGPWIQPGAATALPVLCPAQSTHDAPVPLLAVGNAPLAFARAMSSMSSISLEPQPGCFTVTKSQAATRLILLVDWISRCPQETTDHSPARQTSWPKSTSGVQAKVGRCMLRFMLFVCQVYPEVPSPI